ncbi:MAG: 4Fe-4S dicluster domain-containing protein [Deltaproteobacteria bacterium]|nr:4Fe-4S dicluster domain-containing protein [Deltaproteobacteria bacterium]
MPSASLRKTQVTPSLPSEIRKYGRFESVKCLNCGTCTITCDLTSDAASFPRRPIQFALLGLKEMVLEGLEPWLCHDCGDCSTKCPQQAEPGDSMATLRRYLIAQYDWTGLSGRMFSSKAWAAGSLLITGFLVLLLAALYHVYAVGLSVGDLVSTPMKLDHMFGTITWFTLFVILVPFLILLSHGYRMYRFTLGREAGASIPLPLLLSEAKMFFFHLSAQPGMKKCPEPERKNRRVKHLTLAAGCTLMLLILVFALRWFQTDLPYPVYDPQRWLGYLITAALLYGAGDILIGHLQKKEPLHKRSDFADYVLPLLLFLTALSGISVHVLRYLAHGMETDGLSTAAHGYAMATLFMYALHLAIAVPMLVIEMPFGRWSHMIYRPLALFFQAVREKTAALNAPGEEKSAA